MIFGFYYKKGVNISNEILLYLKIMFQEVTNE